MTRKDDDFMPPLALPKVAILVMVAVLCLAFGVWIGSLTQGVRDKPYMLQCEDHE